jgi:hypothetical protein
MSSATSTPSMTSICDPKDHPQYQYWRDRVRLTNRVLLLAAEDRPIPELRHCCTNYDELLRTPEFKALTGADRVAAYHALHYTATVKPLRHREYQVAEQRNQLLEKKTKFEKAQKELKLLLQQKALQDAEQVEYIKRLEDINKKLTQEGQHWDSANDVIKTAGIELREQCDRIRQDYEDAIAKIKKLEKDLATEKGHRTKLAKNNQSLGAYKGHFNRQKAKTEALLQEVWVLRSKLKTIQRYAEEENNPELQEMAQF